MPDTKASHRDDVRRPVPFLLKYGLPLLILMSSQWWSAYLGSEYIIFTAMVWAVGLAVMGLACLFNARRCGRVHCYFTGPYMLAMSAAFLLVAGGLDLPSWLTFTRLANTALWGAGLLWFGSEMVFGKYFGGNKHAG